MASLLNMSGGSLLKKGLPYDAEIEYLEFTGTQCINTQSYLDPMTFGYEYGITFINDLVGTRTIAGTFGMWDINSYSLGVTGNWSGHYFAFPLNWRATTASSALSSPGVYTEVSLINNNDWDGSKYTLTLKSPLKNDIITFDNPIRNVTVRNPFVIGGIWYGGGPKEFAHIKLYYLRLMRYNEPIFDFIPVRVGQVGYMYDKVSGQLFGNSGTGDFILGPDV